MNFGGGSAQISHPRQGWHSTLITQQCKMNKNMRIIMVPSTRVKGCESRPATAMIAWLCILKRTWRRPLLCRLHQKSRDQTAVRTTIAPSHVFLFPYTEPQSRCRVGTCALAFGLLAAVAPGWRRFCPKAWRRLHCHSAPTGLCNYQYYSPILQSYFPSIVILSNTLD